MLNVASRGAATSSLPVVEDVRRARELYRYLETDNLVARPLVTHSSPHTAIATTSTRLTNALAPFVQLAALRCNAQRALLNVTDRDSQYCLAEASRTNPASATGATFDDDSNLLWVGSGGWPKEGRICETTVKLQPVASGTYPFQIVPDLSRDSRFANLSVVSGPPYFRFYAGTPITTRDRINIGSLCVMDTEVRDTLTEKEQEALGGLARHIMSYLETNREAIEGRRAKKLSHGLNHFIEGKSSLSETDTSLIGSVESRSTKVLRANPLHSGEASPGLSDSSSDDGEIDEGAERDKKHSSSSMDSVSYEKIFGRAANLLRETFELEEGGGVIFVGASKGFKYEHSSGIALHVDAANKRTAFEDRELEDMPLESPARQIRTTTTFDPILNAFSEDPEHPAPLLALSTKECPFTPSDRLGNTKIASCGQVNKEALRELFRRYPKGRLWLFDDIGLVSASDEEERFSRLYGRKESMKRANSSTWKRGEPTVLRKAFPGVRQLMFSPNWDAETSEFTSACFVWSDSDTRVFTSADDLSFLNSFGKTVMAELSRLDTVLADKQKADFIGSISHELRSPLHGILASAEFLADTASSAFQRTLVDTVDSCGRTLLDTINHVLDFSKINSFERTWQNMRRPKIKPSKGKTGSGAKIAGKALPSGAPPLLRLYDITDIAAVAEEVIEGIAVGQIYSAATEICDVTAANRGRDSRKGLAVESHTIGGREEGPEDHKSIEVIVDIDRNDWVFMTQPGALRRVISNLFGNATKYTTKGTIKVRLQLADLETTTTDGKMLILTISDTGKGISPAFLASKLFVPFAQENSLSPGTGLGLSIVRSIVTMLGGSVDLRSRLGEGTTVQVSLPLQRPHSGIKSIHGTPRSLTTQSSVDSMHSVASKDDSIKLLQDVAGGCKVAIHVSPDLRRGSIRDSSAALAKYLMEWYGLDLVQSDGTTTPDVVLVEERDVHHVMGRDFYAGAEGYPALVVLCGNATRHSQAEADVSEGQIKGVVEYISKPCGPYKLAKTLRNCLTKLKASQLEMNRDAQTKVAEKDEFRQMHSPSEDMKELDWGSSNDDEPATVFQTDSELTISQLDQNAPMLVNTPATSVAAAGTEPDCFPFPKTASISNATSKNSPPTILLSPVAGTHTPGMLEIPATSPWDAGVLPAVSPRVLLVDDNKINLSLLRAFMRKRRYQHTDYAEDGSIAVDKTKTAAQPYDVIFMDISMPVMNGFEATRAIRQHECQSDPPGNSMIIALTGLASARDQNEGFLAGCDVYMTKPVSFKEVGKLLDEWEAQKLSNSEGYITPSVDGHGSSLSRSTSMSKETKTTL